MNITIQKYLDRQNYITSQNYVAVKQYSVMQRYCKRLNNHVIFFVMITLWLSAITLFLNTPTGFLTNAFANEQTAGNNILFDKANQDYTEKKYEKALETYKKILNNNGLSASLLYNMGNVFYQTGDIGQAILHYERALILEPNNTQILANLSQVRKNAGLYEDPKPLYMRFFDILSLNQWMLLTSSGLILFCLLIFGWGIFCSIRKKEQIAKPVRIPCKPVAISFAILFMVGILGTTVKYQDLSKAVVMVNDAKLLVSPFKAAAVCTTIKAGRVVYQSKAYGDYLFIKEGNGQTGWIKKSALESVLKS